MRITVVGSGGGIPSPKRACMCMLVEDELLIDIGASSLNKLASSGLSTDGVGRIFITHSHLDHAGDLIPLLWTLDLAGRSAPLYIYGPPGFCGCYRDMLKRVDDEGEWSPPFRIEVSELQFGSRVGEVSACRASHPPPTMALRIDSGAKSVCYSSDTRFSAKVTHMAANVDLLIHEATYLQHQAVTAWLTGHSTAKSAGRVASLAKAKRLLLIHIPPLNEGKDERYLEEAGAEYDGEILLAHDLMTVSV